ncbi:MAG: diguanylate cyclase [Oscillospiraceae bacterium]|nr:diguanylate cyclase [Oscillospiraceae bacterium]
MLGTVISYTLLGGIAVTIAAAIILLNDSKEHRFREFAILGLFCSFIMMASYYMELNALSTDAKIMALKFGYIGRTFVNPVLLVLVLRLYHAKVPKIWLFFLYPIPILTLGMVFTSEQHNLYYRAIELRENGLLNIIPGPFYYLFMAYNIVVAMIFISFCLYQRINLHGKDKDNNTRLLMACMIPFLSLLMYLSGWTGGYDVASVGVMVGALLISICIFRFGLLNKEELLQNMETGLVFLDKDNHLIYANQRAIQIIPALSTPVLRSGPIDFSQLCEEKYASILVGTASYQRRITEWSNGGNSRGKLITFDDITEIRARLNRDAMTGLLNHACFYPMLDEEMENAQKYSRSLTVTIADINSFKKVNDTYGHANGDVILIAMADLMQKICGRCGEVFRYGGEEFSVIFRCNKTLAEQIMQQTLEEFSKIDFDFLPYHVTFSYGSAEYTGKETSHELFERADQIMYVRKQEYHEKEQN